MEENNEGMTQNPDGPDQWQEAADAAEFLLILDAARQYGLVSGGPKVNQARCTEILNQAKAMGITPRSDVIETYLTAKPSGGRVRKSPAKKKER